MNLLRRDESSDVFSFLCHKFLIKNALDIIPSLLCLHNTRIFLFLRHVVLIFWSLDSGGIF